MDVPVAVVMFDFGGTLVDADERPFPNVAAALDAVARLVTHAGTPLRSCLVSDFLPAEPPSPANIQARFAEYLAILAASGLRRYFEPVEKRVTLSTHAGVRKPDRRVFATALRRLGARVALARCLLITEDAEHVAAVRRTLHMQTLRFGPRGGSGVDFDDWREAPALVVARVDPDNPENVKAALQARLAEHGVDVVAVEPTDRTGAMRFSAHAWHSMSVAGHDDLQDVDVPVPVAGRVTRGRRGEMRWTVEPPSDEALAEARSFVGSLASRGQIDGLGGRRVPRPTHEIATDEQGRRKLVRRRMSAR